MNDHLSSPFQSIQANRCHHIPQKHTAHNIYGCFLSGRLKTAPDGHQARPIKAILAILGQPSKWSAPNKEDSPQPNQHIMICFLHYPGFSVGKCNIQSPVHLKWNRWTHKTALYQVKPLIYLAQYWYLDCQWLSKFQVQRVFPTSNYLNFFNWKHQGLKQSGSEHKARILHLDMAHSPISLF